MPRYEFLQVDVFTDHAFGGNPLAVFYDAQGLETAQMQRIAQEMNLSETTFVFPPTVPDADFKVRIFTPESEMPFAGHPVVGTHWALAHLGRVPLTSPHTTVRFELAVGVRAAVLHVDAASGAVTRVVMDHQRPEFGPTASPQQVDRLIGALGLDPAAVHITGHPVQVVSTGVRQLFVPVHSLAAVQALGPQHVHGAELARVMQELDPETHCHNCVMVLTTETVDSACDVHTRLFAPGISIPEDPATGSATGGLGAYLVAHQLVPATPPTTYLQAEQGIEMGRPSRLSIEIDGTPDDVQMVRVGGSVVPLIEGVLSW